ncbi:hypothetical protein AAGW05_02605 [Arthrobacter sp. LAPM80]|uniref:hypothetical protein n=1 Tax=Arthrobacter sp. LAPM80 TaxID=3141788 RepID=UPI00398B7F3B
MGIDKYKWLPLAALSFVAGALVLIVQKQFPNPQLGMATASSNYFRQIGAALGSAVVGSLLATPLATLLTPGAVVDPGIRPAALRQGNPAAQHP